MAIISGPILLGFSVFASSITQVVLHFIESWYLRKFTLWGWKVRSIKIPNNRTDPPPELSAIVWTKYLVGNETHGWSPAIPNPFSETNIKLQWSVRVVGERSILRWSQGVTHGGAYRSENAGTSNRKTGETPVRRNTEVSWAMLISPGLVGPKGIPNGGPDG